MRFPNDIVLCSESQKEVEAELESWRYALERRGMKVCWSKTEYLAANMRGPVRLQGVEVARVDEFKSLGSTVQVMESAEERLRRECRLDGVVGER